MKNLCLVYHLSKADFLERVRRYSFLIVLGLAALAGYFFVPPREAAYMGGFLLYDHGYTHFFRGVYNSAWVGTALATMTALFLSLFGFYLVKNAVERDQRTGVGQILAATPLSKPLYTLGKWLSNVAVLATITGILALMALATQFIRGEVMAIQPAKLLAPFLWIALPPLALVAAVALLFETISWLRGGLGNVVYLLIFFSAIAPLNRADMFGLNLIWPRITVAAQRAYPAFEISSGNIGINKVSGPLHLFHWAGIQWTPEIVLTRLLWIGAGIVIALMAALSFSRFDPARDLLARSNLSLPSIRRWTRRRRHAREQKGQAIPAPEASAMPHPHGRLLTPLASSAKGFRFGRVLLAELRLMLKGQPWWWYAAALGLVVASLLSSLETARRYLLPLAWIWPLLLWSQMGVREHYRRTDELVFSAARLLWRQLPATWLAGLIVALLTGVGVALHLVLGGDGAGLFAWAVGALFIPSLALALGCWGGHSKLFEVVYALSWYAGPMNGLPALDYMGALRGTPGSPCQALSPLQGMIQPLIYLCCTVVLLGLAVAGRRRQLQK